MTFVSTSRKRSRSPPRLASHTSSLRFFRRSSIRPLLWIFGFCFVLYLVINLVPRSQGHARERDTDVFSSAPRVVVVTAIDPARSLEHKHIIEENRKAYAARHGYATFLPSLMDYELGVPKYVNATSLSITWAKIPSVRHAMSLFPQNSHFFYLDDLALIMNPRLSLEDHVLSQTRLEDLIIPNQPVVPSNNIIKTLDSRHSEHTDLILTQDHVGLSQNSFILRSGEWAKYFLDAWFDPLYRSYNFERAEAHALEHLVQWHATILSKLALVPQSTMNSYARGTESELYHDGDLVLNFIGCDTDTSRSCDKEMVPFYERFKELSTNM